jgi:hypothetical protein
MLDDLVLSTRANQHWLYNAIDSPDRCRDRGAFFKYSWPVSYNYNSRGFRDTEWPTSLNELKQAIWCVGDSFTTGLGSALDRTWVHMLQQATGRRCINISLEGASNGWIARRARQILQEIQPQHMVILWSYMHRRESPNAELSDEQRRIPAYILDEAVDHVNYFEQCLRVLGTAHSTTVISAVIPNDFADDLEPADQLWQVLADASWGSCPTTAAEFDALPQSIHSDLKKHKAHDYLRLCIRMTELHDNLQPFIGTIPQQDQSRDGYHFDKLTSEWFVDKLIPCLNDTK